MNDRNNYLQIKHVRNYAVPSEMFCVIMVFVWFQENYEHYLIAFILLILEIYAVYMQFIDAK